MGGAHDEVAGTEREGECGIEFGCVETVVDGLELELSFWLGRSASGYRKGQEREVDVQQRVETRDGGDG